MALPLSQEVIMADCVSISITIGGRVGAEAFGALVEIINSERLSIEWEGPTFHAGHRIVGEPLSLYAHNVPWGRAESLEALCVEQGLPFVRWSGGYPGEWSAERVIFRGSGEADSYMCDENDRIMIDQHVVKERGSIEAILTYFEEADFEIPPLVVDGDPEPALPHKGEEDADHA
ncbi:hypothetical protein [Sphingopyxis sp. HIX]|uniref:hypothetical protein n=2 Tax=Sphingomonadaceae TaxID=41297 RepID=UPI001E53AAEA|nr:hypothetical protein [Sphingopyxis sp. HIX]